MIIIDIHEPDKITSKIVEKLGQQCTIAPLDTGDYTFFTWSGYSVGIERKAFNDLLGSLSSGRLADQVLRLSKEFDIGILLIERPIYISDNGNIIRKYWVTRNHKKVLVETDTGWTYMQVALALMSAWYCTGVLPMFVEDEKWTATFIVELYRWFQRPDEEHGKWLTKPKRIDAYFMHSVPELVLGAIPGIGTELANNLLKKFSTLQNIANASEKDLRDVEGVGKRKAATIYATFRGLGIDNKFESNIK